MLVDSPYGADDLALSPTGGIIAGTLGSVAMLIPLWSAGTAFGVGPATVLDALGGGLLGITLLAAFGGLFGLLYSACQLRVPVDGLVAVGLSYGLLLWLINGRLLGWAFDPSLRSILRSMGWCVACLVYGLCVAAAAIVAGRSHRDPVEVPLD